MLNKIKDKPLTWQKVVLGLGILVVLGLGIYVGAVDKEILGDIVSWLTSE